MCKEGRQLTLTDVIESVGVQIGLIAEVGELGNGLEEFFVAVDSVGIGKASIPVNLREKASYTLHICHAHEILDCAVIRDWRI